METTKTSARGQVVIPKAIREKMGIDAGTTFVVDMLDEERLILKKLDRKKLVEEFNRLRGQAQPKIPFEEIVKEVRAYRDERSNRH